ncbi:MAG: hypothetical protein KAU20_00465, partial [Nanoarchaeota archaeon]|nr:hypothetical protein [Nanoarchaeota archaeon]
MGDNNIENDDEEISIDFSKIKNIFKRKERSKEDIKETPENKEEEIKEKEIPDTEQKEAEKQETQQENAEPKEEEKDDEEISIDFSKIKEIFRRKKQGAKESKEQKQDQDEDISFDIKESFEKTLEFTKKHYLIILILIPIILSIYFRMYPAYLPVTDEWAENSVYNSIKSDIKNQINQQYPNLPDENKNALVDSEFKNILKQNKAQIDEQIKQTSAYFKSKMQDDSGQTYLLAIDPYLWYGEIKASLKSGFFGNEIVDGKKWYTLRNGRIGKTAELTYVVNLYVGLYLYRIMHFFNENISLMAAFFLVPMIIVTLSTIPAFFIGRKIGGNIAGLFAGIIVAINAALLGRTPAGFADTDPYNIFFPLFIAWMFVEAIETTTTKKRIIFSCIGGFLVGLYSKAWSGWWYPMMFVLATLVFCLVYYLIKNYKELKKGLSNYIKIPNIKNTLVIFGCFFSLSMVSVILLSGFNRLIDGLSGPFGFMRLKEVAVKTLWPNVLTTVAEFNVVPLKSIISQMGGNLLFIIAIIGILLTIIIKNKQGKRDIMYASFLTIWFIGATYAFTKGSRFSILMVPAFAIALGIALGITYRYASKWVPKELHINKYISNTIIILLFLLLLIGPIKATHNTAKSEIPSFTDAWHDSLTAIKQDSEDAIITSWWDFGHWFAAISERRVTFDGADQGNDKIHWVGKSLLTSEEKSIGILRMLNCRQAKGPHLLIDYINDTPKAIDIINDIIV